MQIKKGNGAVVQQKPWGGEGGRRAVLFARRNAPAVGAAAHGVPVDGGADLRRFGQEHAGDELLQPAENARPQRHLRCAHAEECLPREPPELALGEAVARGEGGAVEERGARGHGRAGVCESHVDTRIDICIVRSGLFELKPTKTRDDE